MVPGAVALFGIGGLLGFSGISFWPVWVAGAMGAALGDWISYWVGLRFKDDVARMWSSFT
ncbi:Inner membrane protein YabI [compost metagenome]